MDAEPFQDRSDRALPALALGMDFFIVFLNNRCIIDSKNGSRIGGQKMQLEQLRKDMMAAMKARDKERKDAISALVSAVKKNAIDAGCRDDIPEDMVNSTIMKELKTVQEQIDSCPKDRADLLQQYQTRYDIMKEYAPKLLSKEEVKAILQERYADVLATKNKGQIMKAVMQELKGKADGKVINEVVTELC